MTSRREGCPTVLLEAMAMAKPVVVPAHSGCVEIVPSEEYGFLYDLNSPNELVQKTRQAMESKHVGESARERVLRCFDWAVLARQIDVIYEGR